MKVYSLLNIFILLTVFFLSVFSITTHAANVERVISPGGFEIWYVREKSIPVIALSIGFIGGSSSDPINKQGLTSLALNLLNEGAGDLDDKQFQKAVADKAIRMRFRSGRDFIRVSLQTLSKNREEAFRLFGLALTKPRFDLPAINRVRSQLLSDIAAQAKDPQTLASRRWYKAMFGNHPYSRSSIGTVNGLMSISRNDLQEFRNNRIGKSDIFIGASGNISVSEISALVDSTLLGLPEGTNNTRIDVSLPPSVDHLEIIDMEIPQSIAVFGLRSLTRDDPDFYAAYILNYILGGGGFTSRLYKEVRENRGLAYSVYSYLQSLNDVGLLVGGVATRNEAISESLSIIKHELSLLSNLGVTQGELDDAKQAITGGFALRFGTGLSVSEMLVSMQVQGLGIDYIQKRNDYINAVTLSDINSVARRLLSNTPLVTVIVGSPKGINRAN